MSELVWDTCWLCGGSGYVQPNGVDEYCPECNGPCRHPNEPAGCVAYWDDEPRPWELR